MPTFSSALKTQLDAASTKLDWANTLQTALGASRRLRCFHDSNPSAADPAATGTEFLNVGSSGDLGIVAGTVTGFGTLSNTTIKTAVDLASGSAVLRLEGKGHWMQGTLGDGAKPTDFILEGVLSSTVGVAVAPTLKLRPRRLLASGTGPAAPPIKDTTPTIIELVDWSDPADPVVVGTAKFSLANRQDDWVFESEEMAAEIGDVAIYSIDSPIVWNTTASNTSFELGGLLLIASNYNTESGAVQLEQMLCSFKPHGRWATYPAMDTFARSNYPLIDGTTWPKTYGPCTNPTSYDSTYPPPFKINLKRADGTIVFTHEMKAFNDKAAGPINGPQWSQVLTKDEPLVPHFNCGMMLPWQNIRTKRSANAAKYFSGVNSYVYTGRVAKEGPCSNACLPMINAAYQMNGANHWYALQPYPLKDAYYTDPWDKPGHADPAYLTKYLLSSMDPDAFPGNLSRDHYAAYRWTGYKYQPGSVSGHDWKTGFGGVRYDRAPSPAVMTIWASNQNWIRPEGNIPIRDLIEEWGLGYFNHSNHWIRDLKTFTQFPKNEIHNGDWVFASAYYGGGPYGAQGQSMGPQCTIDLHAPGQGGGNWTIHYDASGRHPWGGWQRDSLHSYTNAAWYAIMLNSPMHAILATHDYNTQWISGLGELARPTSNPKNYFMKREMSWRWLAYTMQWKVASQHALGWSRQEVEARFQIELELMYEQIYKPAFLDNSQDPYVVTVRNLGVGLTADVGGKFCYHPGGSLGLYTVHVLVLMRQLGLWSVMKQKSMKCKAVLEMVVGCIDKQVIDYTLDTDMRDAYYPVVSPKGSATVAADIPANWPAQKAMLDTYFPALPPNYMETETDRLGNYHRCQQRTGFFKMWDDHYTAWTASGMVPQNFALYQEQDGNPHMFMQWMKARKVFFAEYPNARVDAAITKLQGYYDSYLAAVAAGKANPWIYFYPSHGELLTPPVIGPN